MRIVILTQDDPFYLGKNIDFLVKNMPKYAQIVGTVLFEVSPFGKRESFFDKMKKTYDVFGLKFFAYYSFKFIKRRKSLFNIYFLHFYTIPQYYYVHIY